VSGVAILGTYNADALQLFDVDLMQYFAAHGIPPTAIVFRTGTVARPGIPLNAIHPIAPDRSVLQVTDFNDPGAVAAMRELSADLFVYAGGRDLLRAGVLGASRLGCIGGHYGPLPDIRGMGTVEWSVLNDQPIVVAIQRFSRGIDTGDILLQAPVALRPDDTFTTIRERCYYWTKILLALSARAMLNGALVPAPQRLEDGRQYYRLNADVLQVASRKLTTRLQAYDRHPWAHREARFQIDGLVPR
jgi:methionyl-tRNA formyltransferase